MVWERHLFFIFVFVIGESCALDVRAAAPITSQNSVLSIPAAVIAATNFTSSPNLAGQSFMLSSVSPIARQMGRASLSTSLQWVRLYDGRGLGEEDFPFAAAVRDDGSVVVTGSPRGLATDTRDNETLRFVDPSAANLPRRYYRPFPSLDGP